MSNYGPPQGQHWGAPDPAAGPYLGYPQPAAPPPKRGNTGIILGIIGMAVLIMLVCAGGFFGLRSMDDEGGNQASRSQSPTDDASTSASASASPKRDGKTISPAGAPYSFVVPTGFREIPPPQEQGAVGAAPGHRSAVAISVADDKDMLIVTSYTLNQNVDSYSDEELATNFDKLVASAKQDASSRESLRVNGNRALRYTFDYGDSKAYSIFVVKGTVELQLRCQWREQETTIKAGCDELLDTLEITA